MVKLYLTAEINLHKTITAELSAFNVADGDVLPNLLKQTHRTINKNVSQ
ncbi:hypothetical protein BTN50_0767 [Candidatus Enterovibrio altilux]|uniref:Mobile element protein n=1 Tax=Candidatus Enterovibrio altilux TaxID=1927128 RepID=A0A291B8F4_9GAMM|nr:hypothetical protein BTN50_0767 [Candidatus Enterovibrio luxaltus]